MSCEVDVDCDKTSHDSEALAEFQECFVMFDKCGEGKIAACLVGRALRALGQNPSNRCIQNDDKIGFDEFKCIMSSYKFKSEREMLDDLIEAFKVFDREEIGLVSACELRCWLEKSEEPLTKLQINDLVKMSGGKTMDDSFDYNEFMKRIVFVQQ